MPGGPSRRSFDGPSVTASRRAIWNSVFRLNSFAQVACLLAMLLSPVAHAGVPVGVRAGDQAAGQPIAPDGRRGFGDALSIQEIVKLLRSDDEEDRKFVSKLFGLESEVDIRAMRVRLDYEKAGYFELLPTSAEHELAPLHQAFFEQLESARVQLRETGEFSPAVARPWSDVSFVLRAELFENLERNLHEVSGGLRFLLANFNGYADVRTSEAKIITLRVDLAAARLRALILDLDSLSQTETWSSMAHDLQRKLAVLSRLPSAEDRIQEFDRLEALQAKRLDAARSVLFSTRLSKEVEEDERIRNSNLDEAERYLQDLLQWIPGSAEGLAAPSKIQTLPKHKRYGTALQLAFAGLSFDPLNADLCYYAGESSEFLEGDLQALSWYDRYLALRGLRAYSTSETRGRPLTDKEQRALNLIQRFERREQQPR